MSRNDLTRRAWTRAALAGGAMALAGGAAAAEMPKRRLGRTSLEASLLGIGTAPLGAPEVTQQEVDRVLGAALDEGVNYLDTAPIYRQAERRLGPALRGRRDRFVLVTKVEATSRQDAEWQVQESLEKLQTDYLDLVHLHNVGRTDRFPDLDVLLGPDGALEALVQLKEKGVVRHIGMTSHLRPKRAFRVLETGKIEAVMCAANFVDVHTYDFEGTVFEAAREKGLGIVAMKVLGGTEGEGAKLSAPEHYERAVRYALGIPGLTTALVGIKSVAELQKAAATVRAYRPFDEGERQQLTELGREMAADWGELRGPVAYSAES